jgi:aldehyde dehydrogenase (NAD+)
VALAEGTTVFHGGQRPRGAKFERGYHLEPTIFTDVRPEMRIAQEEVFGAVMSVLTYTDLDEVVAIANSGDSGSP